MLSNLRTNELFTFLKETYNFTLQRVFCSIHNILEYTTHARNKPEFFNSFPCWPHPHWMASLFMEWSQTPNLTFILPEINIWTVNQPGPPFCISLFSKLQHLLQHPHSLLITLPFTFLQLLSTLKQSEEISPTLSPP